MRKVAALLTILALFAFVGTALAVAPGKTLEFPDGAMGKVIFDGKIHADAGKKCMDCHPKIFQMKQGSTEITSPHENGVACWTCHTGEEGMPTKTCTACHKK